MKNFFLKTFYIYVFFFLAIAQNLSGMEIENGSEYAIIDNTRQGMSFDNSFPSEPNGESFIYQSPEGPYDVCPLSECNFCCTEKGCLAFQADLLYFRPSRDQTAYVITSTDNRFGGNVFPNGRRHLNNSQYGPGFRVQGIYELCNHCNCLDFRFTYFAGGNSAHASGPFLFDTNGFPGDGAQAPEDTTYSGTARIRDHYRYYSADATFNRLTLNCCPENLAFLVGLHYAHISLKETSRSRGSAIDGSTVVPLSNHLHRHSTFWGIGPQFGVDYHYVFPNVGCLCSDMLAININGRAALLCSNTDSSLHYNSLRTSETGVNLRSRHLWRVTPTANARAGLSYHFDFFCSQAAIEVGYEMIWYSKCFNSITGVDVAYAGDTIDLFSSLSLQGPFLALTLAF